MELPNTQNESALELWKKEIIRFKEYLEETFNTTITEEQVRHAVHVANPVSYTHLDVYKRQHKTCAPGL